MIWEDYDDFHARAQSFTKMQSYLAPFVFMLATLREIK